MKIIDKIEIQYFRSLKTITLRNINDLNIFSGKNDVGKSNVLMALDLFFNKEITSFVDDFNKERLEEVRMETIKGKQFINIKITFVNPGTYKSLPAKFYVSKTWDRTGRVISEKDNIEKLFKQGLIKVKSINTCKAGMTSFLNKIRYTYVPAIRDEPFFSFLIGLLQEALFSTSSSDELNKRTTEFNIELAKLTATLEDDFKRVSGISSSLSFPTEISSLFERLIIDTQSEKFTIPMKLRGEGIRMRYIPTILDYISKNTKNYHIWGFDEPENSCEYTLADEISKDFLKVYSNYSQIFVSTHSFHFISLHGKRVTKYRVFKNENNINSTIIELDQKNKELLEKEIGILTINQELKDVYRRLTEEYDRLGAINEKLKEITKPYIIFEGPSDNKHFEQAYKSLYGKSIDSDFKLCEHLVGGTGSNQGTGARKVNDFLFNHITKTPNENILIGIFDFDTEGVNQFNALKKYSLFKEISLDECTFKNIIQHKSIPNVFAITLWHPDFREKFVSFTKPEYCFVSTELLYQDVNIANANKHYPTLYDKTVFGFSGNRDVFVENIHKRIAKGETLDFSGFAKTFELIAKLIEYYRKKYNLTSQHPQAGQSDPKQAE